MASQNSAELGKNARMVIDQLYSKARNDADKEKYRGMYNSTVVPKKKPSNCTGTTRRP
jgi:hypothetical protein